MTKEEINENNTDQEEQNNDELEPDNNDEQEQENHDTNEEQEEQEEQEEDTESEEEDEDATILSLDDEQITQTPENDNSVIRKLRQVNKELKKQLKEKNIQVPENQNIDLKLPDRPKLQDFDYDEEKYNIALDQWHTKKKQVTEIKTQQEKRTAKLQEKYENKVKNYQSQKTELKFSDYDDVEEVVEKSLTLNQHGALIQAAENPAKLIYAIGKKPELLKELSEISDPVEFIAKAVRLETRIKTQKVKKQKANPERLLNGSSGSPDKHMKTYEKLRAEGQKKGDMTKAIQFKRQHKL